MFAGRIMKNTLNAVLCVLAVPAIAAVVLAAGETVNIPGSGVSNGTVITPGTVTVGPGTAQLPSWPNAATITTTDRQTIIDYSKDGSGFSVNQDWHIHFQQPDGGATLNRVSTGNPSSIFGKLTSNGDVYIVNPAGVIFGSSSVVDVKKLVASGLWMEKEDFLNGQMKFTARTEDQYNSGAIEVRAGSEITADEAYLIGKDVYNYGIIKSAVPGTGYVVMAASTSGATILKDPDTGDVFVTLGVPDASAESSGFSEEYEPLGSGDIYSVAVVDAGMVAMAAQRDVVLHNDVTSSGDITIEAGRVINFNGRTEASVQFDQEAVSSEGALKMTGPVEKTTDGNLLLGGGLEGGLAVDIKDTVTTKAGNITIHGAGDVQIGGDITAGYQFASDDDGYGSGDDPCSGPVLNYGVKIVSDNGKIYTQEDGRSDRINVAITGGSDQLAGRGVGLPSDEGQKAAIILISSRPLELGPNATLTATGTYYAENGDSDLVVDDRAAINFRDRIIHQGDPIDVAIYVQSTNGDVTLDNLELLQVVPDYGTAVLDAFNTVTIGNTVPVLGDTSGAFGSDDMYYLYRLEVCSRNTLRLQQAIDNGTLPLANDPCAMELLMGGGTYVLRGGVQEDVEGSPLLGAWVLYDDVLPPPSPSVTAILPALAKTPTDDGCPALIQAAAEEIGQDPAMFRTGTLVNMKSMQPCSTCERLMRSADILKDPDGKRLTALGQTINEFVTTQAPPSPEQMASVSQTLAMRAKEGASYAAAQEWVDALATYVGVLRSEIGLSQADALAIATGKYGAPAKSNEAVKAFIAKKLAELAG
jgi:filamentous hemagglutinin family protein